MCKDQSATLEWSGKSFFDVLNFKPTHEKEVVVQRAGWGKNGPGEGNSTVQKL